MLFVYEELFFTARNSSCGKVMFSQVSVCPGDLYPSIQWVGCVSQHVMAGGLPGGVSAQGGVYLGECVSRNYLPMECLPGGVWPGGVLPRVSTRGGVCPRGCTTRIQRQAPHLEQQRQTPSRPEVDTPRAQRQTPPPEADSPR